MNQEKNPNKLHEESVLPVQKKGLTLKGVAVATFISWTLFILTSWAWNIVQHEKEVTTIIEQMGRVSLERDILYRQWNTMHGGVYVPVTAKTKPNIYLPKGMVPPRDLAISPELTLTLINPAYMTRQVYELAVSQNKISGHLSSLNPINPINLADDWETKAFHAIEQGADEYIEIVKKNGLEYLRLMIPFKTEKGCLKCHAYQGYKEGDLRGGISTRLSVAAFHKAGSRQHWTITIAHLLIWIIGSLGVFIGYGALARREAERVVAEKQIFRLAHYDSLTGLVNRNLFSDRVTQAFSLAERHGHKVGLLYIDLDQFKPINDTHGHWVGDQVLKEVAERLSALIRKSDTVARMGGDEFAVILPEIDDGQDMLPLARKIISTIKRPIVVEDKECTIGASIGMSCFPDDGSDIDTLLKKADATMYEVKKTSKGGFRFAGDRHQT